MIDYFIQNKDDQIYIINWKINIYILLEKANLIMEKIKFGSDNDFTIKMVEKMVGQMMSPIISD